MNNSIKVLAYPAVAQLAVTVAVPAEDVLHLLVHVREVAGAEGQEGVGLGHTGLPVQAAVKVQVDVGAS